MHLLEILYCTLFGPVTRNLKVDKTETGCTLLQLTICKPLVQLHLIQLHSLINITIRKLMEKNPGISTKWLMLICMKQINSNSLVHPGSSSMLGLFLFPSEGCAKNLIPLDRIRSVLQNLLIARHDHLLSLPMRLAEEQTGRTEKERQTSEEETHLEKK